MKYKFLLLAVLHLVINSASAQWHFTMNVSYNNNCSNLEASLLAEAFYQSYASVLQQLNALSYPTQADCNMVKQEVDKLAATQNFSSGGCYFRLTSTPCMGNTGGSASGGFYGETSLYNNTGSGGYVFSPTERDINQNTYEELLMRMEALGYNSENAKNFNPNRMSAKTGDDDFDNKFMNDLKNNVNNTKSDDNELKPTQLFYDLSMRRTGASLYGDNYYPGEYPNTTQIYQPGYDNGRFKFNEEPLQNDKEKEKNYFDAANEEFINGKIEDVSKTIAGAFDEDLPAIVGNAFFGAKVINAIADGDYGKAGSLIMDDVKDWVTDFVIDKLGGTYSNMIQAGKGHVENMQELSDNMFNKDFTKSLVDAIVDGKKNDVEKVDSYFNNVWGKFFRNNTENTKGLF